MHSTGSSPFVNSILFGHSKTMVDADYIEKLKPFMHRCEIESIPEEVPDIISSIVLPTETPVTGSPKVTPTQKNTLFWSVFLATHEYPEYIEAIRRSGNREVEEKLKIVDSLKSMPKVLKETNAKLTLEATQALYGALLTCRDDRLEFCTAYAAYYKKTIWILYPKTYRVYSPTQEIVVDSSNAILIWANPGPRNTFVYSLDQSNDTTLLNDLISCRETVLKAQSSYKTDELETISKKLGLDIYESGKRKKKGELYDTIKVAIHKDMSFE